MNQAFLEEYGYDNVQKNMCVEYTGHMSQGIIKEMLLSLKIEASIRNMNLSTLNKVNTTFIEITQNILKYSKRLNNQDGNYLNKIIVFTDSKQCYLVSSNVVGKRSKDKITASIDEIQTYDKNQIKEKYFELCKNGDKSHIHGAGVGLYQIAVKSDNIKYTIDKIQDTKYHLNIMVTININ